MINVRLDPRLWTRAKVAAGQRGITLERWVTEALEAHLAHQPQVRVPDASDLGSPAPSELARRVASLEEAVEQLAQAIGAALVDEPAVGLGPTRGAAAQAVGILATAGDEAAHAEEVLAGAGGTTSLAGAHAHE